MGELVGGGGRTLLLLYLSTGRLLQRFRFVFYNASLDVAHATYGVTILTHPAYYVHGHVFFQVDAVSALSLDSTFCEVNNQILVAEIHALAHKLRTVSLRGKQRCHSGERPSLESTQSTHAPLRNFVVLGDGGVVGCPLSSRDCRLFSPGRVAWLGAGSWVGWGKAVGRKSRGQRTRRALRGRAGDGNCHFCGPLSMVSGSRLLLLGPWLSTRVSRASSLKEGSDGRPRASVKPFCCHFLLHPSSSLEETCVAVCFPCSGTDHCCDDVGGNCLSPKAVPYKVCRTVYPKLSDCNKTIISFSLAGACGLSPAGTLHTMPWERRYRRHQAASRC